MPIRRCTVTKDGKKLHGWQYGDQKCYTGPGAKKKAIKQGIAIEKGGGPKFEAHADADIEVVSRRDAFVDDLEREMLDRADALNLE